MLIEKLSDGVTMQLYLRVNGTNKLSDKILFASTKQWLHPLFELEEFLEAHSTKNSGISYDFEFEGGLKASRSNLFIRDRIIGLAAAFLILKMGIKYIETDIISQRAIPILNDNLIKFETIQTIDSTNCMTEDLLKDIYDTEEAYKILADRRMKALEKMKTE